jgi:hypothetical protein
MTQPPNPPQGNRPPGQPLRMPVPSQMDEMPTMVGQGGVGLRTPSGLFAAPPPGVRSPSGLHTDPTIVANPQTKLPAQGDSGLTHYHVDGGSNQAGRPGSGSGSGTGGTGTGTHKGQVWGDFLFDKLLGKGGMGSVYLGKQLSLDRLVAIKVLPDHLAENENFRNRFLLEAKAVAQIQSPHVIQVYSAGAHEGHYYFVMEFVDGKDLQGRLKDGMRPSPMEALGFVLQAAKGLAAAGELGIVHRDIKPGNMMVDKKGMLKLMDFGLVKLAAENHSLTMTGTIMGTVSYFSPEQGRGMPCDQRTDLYALGVVFYELLTGRLPFIGADATSVIYQHIHVDPQRPRTIEPGIPETMERIVLALMAKKPDDRYRTAQDLVDDLELVKLGQAPKHLPGAAVGGGGNAGGKRSSLPLVAGLAAAVVAAGGAGWWFLAGPGAATPAPVAKPVAVQPQPVAEPVAPDTPVSTVPTVPDKPANPEPAPPRPVEKPVEATTTPTVPVVAVAPGTDLKPQTEAAITAKRWSEARALVSAGGGATPDAIWETYKRRIDAGEGSDLVAEADAALTRGDLDVAGAKAASAQALVPDSAALKAVLAAIGQKEGERKQLSRSLEEIDNLIAEGKSQSAEELAGRIAIQYPDNSSVLSAQRRAKAAREKQEATAKAVRQQLDIGEQAMARRDWDSAQNAFIAAQGQDAQNPRAAAGLEAVAQARTRIEAARAAFQAALDRKDLAGAETALANLRVEAPESKALQQAESALAASKLREEAERRQKEEDEARKSGLAKAVLDRIADPAATPAQLDAALADFVAKAGSGRPEQVIIERKLGDRRARDAITGQLASLDAAVLRTDGAGIGAVVADREFATALAALGRYKGLVFTTTLTSFMRDGDVATAQVGIRHALDVFPERVLPYRLDLRRVGGAWQITAAHPETPAEPTP